MEVAMNTDSSKPPETPPHGSHEPMVEGEEPPPPRVKLMAFIRWVLLGFAALLAVSAWWSYASAQLRGNAGNAQAAKYHCPMHPQIVSDVRGECPICHMSLEPITSSRAALPAVTPNAPVATVSPAKAAASASSAPAMGNISAVSSGAVPPGTTPLNLTLDRIQAIGVRTALATEGNTTQALRVTAVVAPTEQGVAEVHVRSPGFVERILVNQTGMVVGRDQPLFAIYSPEILQAQTELIATQQWAAAGTPSASAESARRKLELLGMSSKDIDKVAKTREPIRAIPVYAQQGGHVLKKNIVAGSYVTPEMALYEIQDLSQVYVIADVYQRDLGVIQKGTSGRFIPARRPDQAVDVRVDLVYPTINPEARTTRVRTLVKNPKAVTFRPGEFGSVEFAAPGRSAVMVPRDSVIDTGLHTYVFVVMGEGVFSPREVVLGEEQEEMLTVLAGVAAGDRVVSGATFLIDSESRLQASASQAATAAPSEPRKPTPGEGPSCDEIDRAKFPDKWVDCQKCAQVHHGMGSMEADCKNAIPKPWK
jgi:Cu(I)/Ag(I) efflux system membrane fusion protein